MRPFGVLLWIALVLGLGAPAHAGTVTIELGAKITAVDLKSKRATINRGAKAGLKVDAIGEIYPMRESVEFNERLARGKVVSVKPDSAEVALEAVLDTVDVGSYFLYSARVDDQLAKSPLFRIIALGVELRGLETKDPILTTEQMLADPTPALRDKAIDKALAEMRTHRDVIDTVGRISGGTYHGRSAGEIADTLTRDELNAFFVFVESFPGKYVNRHWRIAEIFFTWVISKTPSGEPERKLRAAARLIGQARQAERDGKLDDARKLWENVLRDIPDHKQARQHVEDIFKMQLWMRQVTADKDDTWARAQLAAYLFDIGAYALALPHVDALIAAKYEVFQQTKLKAKVLAGQGKFREAEVILAKLVKERPQNTDAAHWHAYVKARGRLEKSPDDPAARLALARVYHDEEAWNDALLEYRRVLDLKGATQAHKDTVKAAQAKISLQRDLATQIDYARTAIRAHDLTSARKDIDAALALVTKLGDTTRGAAMLSDLADAAGAASEEEFRLELLQKRAATAKDELAQRALVNELIRTNRYDEASAAVAKLKEASPYLLATIARARGDLAAVEKHSASQVAARLKQTWPYVNMASVEAARGNWQEAIDFARKAQDLKDPTSVYLVRNALSASLRGLQASEALRSTPSSPRERLRLVRALAALGLVKAANAEIAKLPADGTWRSDGYWAIAGSSDSSIPLAETIAAMRAGKANTPARKRVLAMYEAQQKLRAKPKDDTNRIAFAKLQLQTGDPNRALAVLGPLMTATPLSPAVSDLVRDARAYLDMQQHLALASDAVSRNEHATAMKLALEYQAVMDRIGEPLAQASARESRINILTDQGKYADAIKLAEESLAMMRADGDPELIGIGEAHLARLHASIGTNEPLRKALEKNLRDCDDRDSDICLYNAHYELSKVMEDDGNQADALEHARKAWAIAERLGDGERARGARLALARRNYTTGRFGDANELLVKLLVDARNMTDTDDEQRILLLLGAIAMYRGQGPAAREKFAAVYDLGTRVGHNPWRAVGRRMEGLSYMLADHDPAKAEPAFEQAIKLYVGDDADTIQTRAMALRQLASARLKLKKLPAARKAAEEALAITQRYQRRGDLATAHSLMAEIAVAEGNANAALASAKLAFDFAKTSDDNGLLSDIWDAQAQALVLAKKDEEAVAAYEKALDYTNKSLLGAGGEAERDAAMSVGGTREMFRRAVDLLLRLGKTKRAMEILESSRDAQLKQSFDATTVRTKDVKVRAKLDKYEQARDRVAGLEKQLDAAKDKPTAQRSASQEKALGEQIAKTRAELKEVALDLKVTHRHLYRALAFDPQTLMDRRGELPAGSVVIEYFPAGDSLYAFVISASLTQPAVVKVKVSSDELAKVVTDFRAAVIQENERTKARDKVEKLGRQLDDWLLQPLRTHLDGATSVIVIPFGPLYYVPFDALVVSDAGQPVRYAIEDFRISVQTATTLEYLMKAPRPRGTGSLLAVSNPDGTLPGAQREVTRITKTIPDAKVLGRKDGTVKKFSELVGSYRIVHLATHGLLDPDPRKSYLKMSDGQLTVRDIAKLQGLDQINELVVLSACESATEQGETAGDELVSLAISFAMAGAPALVASLWEVDDESTADLMVAFYRALEQPTGDRLDALRAAKLNLLKAKSTAAPWYWSSFQLYGDYRTPAAK